MISDISEVIKKLGLGTRFHTSESYGEVTIAFGVFKRSVLACSDVNLNEGATDTIYHVSLLTSIDSGKFSVISPSQDGKDYPLNFVANDWSIKKFHGVILI